MPLATAHGDSVQVALGWNLPAMRGEEKAIADQGHQESTQSHKKSFWRLDAGTQWGYQQAVLEGRTMNFISNCW